MDVEFTQVTSGLIVAEGPVALDDGSVLLVEVLAGRITSASAGDSPRLPSAPVRFTTAPTTMHPASHHS